ncbi:MAG: hypothetical protein EBX36_07600, partial [Planctomycetia bacterium]|nr:hypothetical protein [Planctomycetia bacterium]
MALILCGGGLRPLLCAVALAVTVLSSAPSPAGAADGPIAARSGFRRLAPNALTVIPPRTSSDSRAIRGDLLEVTEGLKEQAWQPHRAPANTTLVEQSRNLEFQRDIWCLEFAFKPPRMIDIDVPTTELRMQRKRIWYLVYRVRNVGGVRTVIDKDDPTKRTDEPFETPVRFLPHFVLESMEGLTEEEGETAYRSYLDRVVPGAMGPIRRREDPSRELLDSAGMAAADIPPGEERWGVAVWEDVDPRIDFFTISVRGLTNAIRWRRRSDATFARDNERRLRRDVRADEARREGPRGGGPPTAGGVSAGGGPRRPGPVVVRPARPAAGRRGGSWRGTRAGGERAQGVGRRAR